MPTRILVTDSINEPSRVRLLADGYEIVKHHYEPDELGAALREFDAVIVRSFTQIRKPQIDEAKGSRLKLILRAGVGTDNIDAEEAEKAGIRVRNLPLSASNAVAELTVGMLFACARRIVLAGTLMKEERWEKKVIGEGFELMGKTLGVIGYGRIGRLVGEKAQALGMNVLSSVHRHKPEGCECGTMHFVSMEELYRRSDAIALCTPGVGSPLIDRETLALMKDGVVIVNTSRGVNVDEDALLEALDSGKVSFAALDVWQHEKSPNWALAKHPHVVPLPHLGASTAETQARIAAEIVSVIEENLPIPRKESSVDPRFAAAGFYPADILLPKTDMTKWSVVACDQFTSEPAYWESVDRTVGSAPSTLRLILPEAHLADPDVEDQIRAINRSMEEYLREDLFTEYPDALLYIERTQSDGRIRRGLIGMVDLEAYDFTPGSGALIRATEGTVLERIPPRVRVRKDAPLELPHIMLLIDDPGRTVIEPLGRDAASLHKVYDFDLMEGGGHLTGWLVGSDRQAAVASALTALADPALQEARYGLSGIAPMLFAVGDGNHSLATAKRCYEMQKAALPASEWAALPARYALVEVVNNHDDALDFEPIHRVLFGADTAALRREFAEAFPGVRFTAEELPLSNSPDGQVIRFLCGTLRETWVIPHPEKQLAVGTLQGFLDGFLRRHPCQIDYIHDDDVVLRLAVEEGNCGFMLPAMRKDELFRTVIADGVLPRKTFSMGHARDKRYYTEARKIR